MNPAIMPIQTATSKMVPGVTRPAGVTARGEQ